MAGNFAEEVFKVRRQPGVVVRGVAEGDPPPKPRDSGLWFETDSGRRYFLPIPADQLPSQREIDEGMGGRLIDLFLEARKRAAAEP